MPAEINALLRGDEPNTTIEAVQTALQVVFAPEARIPPALPGVLARFLAQRPVVQAACLGWIKHPADRQGHVMFAVATDREAALAGFGSVQIDEVTRGETLDIMVVPPNEEKHRLSNVQPFYVRSSRMDAPQTSRRRLFKRSRGEA